MDVESPVTNVSPPFGSASTWVTSRCVTSNAVDTLSSVSTRYTRPLSPAPAKIWPCGLTVTDVK